MSGPVNNKDVADQIAKLYELHKSGALTESEFENAKQRVLGDSPKPPRLVAQPPPVGRYEYQRPTERSAFYHIARGFMIFVAGFAALVVAGVVVTAIFGDGGNDGSSNGASTTDDPGPLLTGIVVMMGVANTEEVGAACHGTGEHAALAEGTEVQASSPFGREERRAWLSDGTVDQYGHCRMAFGITYPDLNQYRFDFDSEIVLDCDRNDVIELDDGNYTTQLRFAPNANYCQAPAN